MAGIHQTIVAVLTLVPSLVANSAGPAIAADTFPNKPVRILVPYAAGGAVDVLARTIGQSLSKN